MLLGMSGGAATSVAYAVQHPHRVSKLVLFGGYAQGRNKRDSPQDAEEAQAFLTMARKGWGDDRSAFARAFFSFWLPAGSPERACSGLWGAGARALTSQSFSGRGFVQSYFRSCWGVHDDSVISVRSRSVAILRSFDLVPATIFVAQCDVSHIPDRKISRNLIVV